MASCRCVPKTGCIMTKRDFGDFMLHAEFKTPQMPANVKGQGRGNSGIYIQRRYELQILDSYGLEPKNNEGGSIYTFKAPDINASKKPGEWQSYDILFRAARWADKDGKPVKTQNARITVFQNGVLIHDNVEVPRKTGAGQPEGPKPRPDPAPGTRQRGQLPQPLDRPVGLMNALRGYVRSGTGIPRLRGGRLCPWDFVASASCR